MRRLGDEDIKLIGRLYAGCERNASWAARMFRNERGYSVNRSTVGKYWKELGLSFNGRGGDTRSQKYLVRVRLLGVEIQECDRIY